MIRVFIVSQIRLYREGLAEMLSRDGRLEVAGTASRAADLLESPPLVQPDILLVDCTTPDTLEPMRSLRGRIGNPKVVALGISENRRQVLSCAEAGVAGYVCRNSSLEELIHAIECAVRGELECPPRIAGALLGQVGKLAARAGSSSEVYLTPRQSEVAALLDRGYTNQQIGSQLNIEVSTVKIHVHNIFDKLDVSYRGQAVAKLRRHGLLS